MRLSLAVAAKAPCDPRPFLDALAAERLLDQDDVDVHLAHDALWQLDGAERPRFLHLHHCPDVASVLRLWGVALARSHGTYVAALDVSCPPEAGWLRRALAEIELGTPLFFGPVEPGWAANDPRILGYLVEYAQFKRPFAGTLDEVPGNNVVCRRELLAPANELVERGFFKTFTVWRLARERGLSPRQVDEMAVVYRKGFGLSSYLRRRRVHGRCFAAMRHGNPGQPLKLLCLAATPLLPVLRCARIYRAVRPHGELAAAFFRHLPWVLLAETAWSFGEFLGYARGERGACAGLD